MTREEQWKPIQGYDGVYEVSNCGNVRSIDRVIYKNGGQFILKGVNLKSFMHNTGYPTIGLSKKACRKLYRIHRLVAIHFVPGFHPLKQVNHIDENKANPHYTNLEWVTPKQNIQHSLEGRKKNATTGSKNHNSKIVLNLNTGIFYDCAREAAFVAGIKYKTFMSIMRGEIKNKTPFIYA